MRGAVAGRRSAHVDRIAELDIHHRVGVGWPRLLDPQAEETATDEALARLTTAAGAHGVAVSGDDGAWVLVTHTFADSRSSST